MQKKLLLFDVDGTLISYDGIVPESTITGIKQAREKGHQVFVVTGRTKNRATVGNIEVDGMICGNGAYIECDGVTLKDLSLSLKDMEEITQYLDKHHLDYFTEGNDGLYGSKHFEENAVETYRKYGIKNPVIRELYPMMTFPESMVQPSITQVNYILKSYDDYLQFKDHFLTWGGKGEKALFGDCAIKGIDKEKAIQKLISYLKIDPKNIYAFGDAKVDISMFNIARTSICVGSGSDEAKKAATYITDDVKDDGIYNALKHFNLI